MEDSDVWIFALNLNYEGGWVQLVTCKGERRGMLLGIEQIDGLSLPGTVRPLRMVLPISSSSFTGRLPTLNCYWAFERNFNSPNAAAQNPSAIFELWCIKLLSLALSAEFSQPNKPQNSMFCYESFPKRILLDQGDKRARRVASWPQRKSQIGP